MTNPLATPELTAANAPKRAPLSPAILAAVAFTASYTLAAAIAALSSGNGEFVFYLVVMVLLAAGIWALHMRVEFTGPAVWALSVWGALHMAGGLVPVPADWPINGDIRVLYSWWILADGNGSGWLKYDHVVHAFGFGVATWVCWQALRGAAPHLKPTAGLCVLVALAGLGLGAVNEVVEFAATQIADTNVGGYVNTGWDLVANSVGATIAAITIWTRGRIPSSH